MKTFKFLGYAVQARKSLDYYLAVCMEFLKLLDFPEEQILNTNYKNFIIILQSLFGFYQFHITIINFLSCCTILAFLTIFNCKNFNIHGENMQETKNIVKNMEKLLGLVICSTTILDWALNTRLICKFYFI